MNTPVQIDQRASAVARIDGHRQLQLLLPLDLTFRRNDSVNDAVL